MVARNPNGNGPKNVAHSVVPPAVVRHSVTPQGDPETPEQAPPLFYDPCLGGRSQIPTVSGIRKITVNWIFSPDVTALPPLFTPINTQVDDGVTQREPSGACRLWQIRTYAAENTSLGAQSSGRGNPTAGSAGLPQTGATASGRSMLFVKVATSSPGGGDEFNMDAGGDPVEIYANEVSMWLFVPALAGIVTGPQTGAINVANNSLAVHSQIGLEILAIEESRGSIQTTLTDRLNIAANGQDGFEIPRHAKRVTIYQHPNGAASSAWSFRYGGLPGNVNAGPIPFIPGTRKTEPVEIIPGATTIMSDVDPANARAFTVVWEIEP